MMYLKKTTIITFFVIISITILNPLECFSAPPGGPPAGYNGSPAINNGDGLTPATMLNDLKTVAEDNAGYGEINASGSNAVTIIDIVASIIKTILGFLGILFLILIIISGFQWMTAGGNEETVTKAKKRVMNATMGLAIVILSYVISYFIMAVLYTPSIQV